MMTMSQVEGTQYGGITGRGTDDMLAEIGLLLKEAAQRGVILPPGAAGQLVENIDFEGCFNNLAWEIIFPLLEAQGAPSGLLRAWRGLYVDPSGAGGVFRACRASTGVGEFWDMSNGLFQGCALSVLTLNALMSVLTRTVTREAGVDQCMIFVVDDAYISVEVRWDTEGTVAHAQDRALAAFERAHLVMARFHALGGGPSE